MRSGKQLPVDYVPQPALYNRSSTLTVFSLLPSTISHWPEQTFNLVRQRSEPGAIHLIKVRTPVSQRAVLQLCLSNRMVSRPVPAV